LNVQDWGITDICIQDWDADRNIHIRDSNICCPCNLNWNATEGLSVLSRNVDILTMVPPRSLCTFCTRLLQIVIFRLYNLAVMLGNIAMRMYTCITPFIPRHEWWPPYIYRLDLTATYSCLTLHITVSDQCRQIKIHLMQHLFKRHDFAAIQKSLRRYTVIFILCSQLSMLIIQIPALNLQLFSNTSNQPQRSSRW
jgi:hypothetical protein